MADGSYLVVELPQSEAPGVAFTMDHPECVIDLAVARVPGQPAGAEVLDAVMLARNLGPDQPRLAAALAETYGRIATLQRDAAKGTWLASFRIPLAALADRTAHALGQFLVDHTLDMHWIRVEQDRVFLRAQVGPQASATELADQLRGYFEALGIEADVGTEVGTAADAGPWRDLVARIREQSGAGHHR